MAHYRIYFLNGAGRIAAAENIEAADDAAALEHARAAFAGQDRYPGFELWQGERQLHIETVVG